MERISKKRRAKSEKPQFPKLRSKYGVNRSFTFSLRAWFNFKLFAVILIALIALAVITFTQLEPADFSGEKFTDAFYTYHDHTSTNKENASENAATSHSPIRMVGGDDIVLLAAAHEHVWTKTDETVIVEGNCNTEEVVKITETCTCGEIRITTETKDVVHDPKPTVEPGVAPTCDTEGYEYDVYTCDCGTETARVKRTLAPLGHVSRDEAEQVEIERVEPTCTTAGYIKVNYECNCGTVIETTIVTLGAAHDFVSTTTITVYPTCTESGEGAVELKCTVCGHVASNDPFVLEPLGHDSDISIPAVAPNCTDAGLTEGKKCSVCDTIVVEQQVDPAKGHHFNKCTDNKCADCPYTRETLNHDYQKFVIDFKAPTCTEDGYEEYYMQKCTVCEDILTPEAQKDVLPATGHESSGEATCSNASVCKNCGEVLAAAKDHTYNKCCDKQCAVCNQPVESKDHVDKNGDHYCDLASCRTHLREFNTAALLYTICLVATIILAVIFLVLVVILILTAFKVSSMRLDFYDEVVVWRWGRVFKRHIEQRFIGVYDVLVMPRNKLYYKDSVEKKKPAKFGTVLAKVPGGGYEWNRKFFGVKEYIELKNYLESKKITERFERPRSNFHDDSI